MSDKTQGAPLVIVGFDSGDPRLLRQWAEEGHLPALSSLMGRGCWARTSSAELLFKHGAWLSIVSGESRGSHGYYYFRQLVHGTYDLRLTYGPERKALPFWSSLRNQRVLVIDVPDIPMVKGIRGAQVANWAVHRGYISHAPVYQPRTEPAGLLEELTHKFGSPGHIIEAPAATAGENRRLLHDLLAQVRRKGELCRYLLAREQPDVMAVSFGESHTAGHQFWRFCADASGHHAQDGHEFRSAIRDVYQAIDHELKLLLEQMPASINVVVLSTIGLADHFPTGALMKSFCAHLGYEYPTAPSAVTFNPMSLARRIVPERLRIRMSGRFSRETRERLFAQQFSTGTDWQRTRAFAIPSIYTGFVRVNLRGREPQGIVEPGAEYEALLRRLESDLLELIDPQTERAAIEKVVATRKLYDCNYPEVLPDLLVQWKPATHFISRVVHPQGELVQGKPEFFRDSEHIDHGFFAAAGPAIQNRGQIADVEVLDLAPTFLTLLNEPKPKQMTGNVIKDLLQTKLPIHVS